MGVRADRSDEIVLTYVGDGATSQGDANEAFNWAGVTDAPISLLLPEQPVGDIDPGEGTDQNAVAPAGDRIWARVGIHRRGLTSWRSTP